MRNTRVTNWVGQDLINLLALDIKTLQGMYGYKRDYLATVRHRKRKEIKEGKIKMPAGEPNFEHLNLGDIPEGAEVNYHFGFIKNADGEIEYTRALPSIRAAKNGQNLSDFISQADPVKITPDRRKAPQRDYRLIYAFGDAQIDYRQINGELHPIHDERALSVHRLLCRTYQPDTIVNLGDTVDLAALSRFPADSDHFQHSMRPAFNRVHRMYAELRADNPEAHIVEVDSNHNTRLTKFVLKNAMPLWGMQQAGTEGQYPVLSYPFLANLDALNIDWVSGYGAAEFVYGEEGPQIVFKHGTITGPAGTVMSKEAKMNPEVNVVRGHSHQAEIIYRTNRAGRYLAYVLVGASCSITGDVPSYHSAVNDRGQVVKNQEGWQQGGLMITDYGNGNYQFDQILIRDGIAFYDGREFDGNVCD